MVETSDFHIELATGKLYTDQACIDQVEAGEAPRNLIQLHSAGKLLVAEAVVLEEVTDGGGITETDTPGIIPLRQILNVEQYGRIRAADGYEHLDVREWTRQDYIDYGRWLDAVTRELGQDTSKVSERVITQAYYLGVGPGEQHIRRKGEFKTLSAFYDEAGIVPFHKNRRFESWSDQQLTDHAEAILLRLIEEAEGQTGYVNLTGEITRLARTGQGPSLHVYKRRGGTPASFLATRGYVDVMNMEPDDYVQWGVDFMRANGGLKPSVNAITFLSHTRRAPSAAKFNELFQWDDYLARVREGYKRQVLMDFRSEVHTIRQEVKDKVLPEELMRGVALEKFPAVRAKWMLVNEMFPNLVSAHKRVIARHVGADALMEVLRDTGSVDEQDIRCAADKLGITEQLWPSEHKSFKPYLRVPKKLPGSSK